MLYLLHQTIDRAADRDAEHPALRFAGKQLTYGQLARESSRLAHVLMEEGVRRGDRVGLYVKKGLEAVVGLYGSMKAGAAYVPLDPTAPVARLAYILRDCGIRHLVTEPEKRDAVRRLVAEESVSVECIIGIDSRDELPARCIPWSDVHRAPDHTTDPGLIEQDLAYILYTSGSTGVPKGVVHTHHSALSFAVMAADTYGFSPEDRLSNHAPLHFDLTTLDFFSAAAAGATTVIIPEAHARLPASLSQLMEDERLTIFYAVPFALIQLLLHGALPRRDLESLRWVLFGGEPFPPKHLRALMNLLPGARFCNVYGPTETNGCTCYTVPPLEEGDDRPIPIGTPYDNVETLIVDTEDRTVTPGEPGELLVRSPTVMRGYWGRPDLNARAFYSRPAFEHFEDVFHRTGDLVMQAPDGNLLFLGRKDRQVKVRGFRVELDEIEFTLLSHESVEAAAAFSVSDGEERRRIEAAVIPRDGALLHSSDMLSYLAARLSSYAIPERITIADQFPRTSTGKIDRIRLAALARTQSQ